MRRGVLIAQNEVNNGLAHAFVSEVKACWFSRTSSVETDELEDTSEPFPDSMPLTWRTVYLRRRCRCQFFVRPRRSSRTVATNPNLFFGSTYISTLLLQRGRWTGELLQLATNLAYPSSTRMFYSPSHSVVLKESLDASYTMACGL